MNDNNNVAEYTQTEAALAELRQRYEGMTFDVTTTKGDKEARSARLELVKLRTNLEAKRITSEIVKLEEPIDQLIKAEESRKAAEKAEKERIERERIAGIQSNILALTQWPQRAIGKSADDMKAMLAELSGFVPTADVYAEFVGQAEQAMRQAIETLSDMTQRAVEQEQIQRQMAEEAARLEAERQRIAQEQAELRRQEAEAAAARRAQEEAYRIKREAEEAAHREALARQQAEADAARHAQEAADRARREEEERQHNERLAAERQRIEAERAELERMQREMQQQAAQEDAQAQLFDEPAPAPAKKNSPSDHEIIEVLALHFRAHESTVIGWLMSMDFESACERMAKEFA